MIKLAVVAFFVAGLAFGADAVGVPPRVDRTQYAVAMFNESLAVAAEVVPAEKVRRQFGAEVESHYLVVEVGMYPRDKSPVNVRREDFTLRVNRARDIFIYQVPRAILEFGQSLRVRALELLSKSLPEISTHRPVAGYLYFPLADNGTADYKYELEYTGHQTRMILPLLAGN
jgi:hypothetical protein